MKKLKDIFECSYNTLISDIKTDSREIKKGDLFIAVHGFNVDHSDYIDDAIKSGANAIVTDIDYTKNNSIPVIKVDNINDTLVSVCKKFYNYNENMNLIGITGTDGKTTTATIIKNILNSKKNTAYIGTNGIEFLNQNISTDNTTPTPEKLYKYLDVINKNGICDISMEVSSEALFHERINGLRFQYAIFTNITGDHLNIHKTYEEYVKAKLKLIDYVKEDGFIIINLDDKNLKKIPNSYNKKVITYGKNKNSDYIINNIKLGTKKTTFDIINNKNVYHIESNFFGEYNVYNLTAAFIVCLLEKMSSEEIINIIKNLSTVKGRSEMLYFGQNYSLILDYAHTLNGIKNIVNTFRNKNRKIIVVTGSAGGREKEKRKDIGKFLLDNVDLVIFTMDDPRYENVDDIIDDMIGNSIKTNYKRIISRPDAIKCALSNAKKDDIVLILGKGRDNYMAVGDKKIPYSDYLEIQKYFKK